MSWSKPQHLAPFPAGPFAGLAVPEEVTVSRQVLAEPSASLPGATWATLADGTPLVTAAQHGAGEIVLFHVTANADWSDLPLSGLFVDMLRRLVQRAQGVAGAPESGTLPPAQSLDGAGVLGPPPAGAQTDCGVRAGQRGGLAPSSPRLLWPGARSPRLQSGGSHAAGTRFTPVRRDRAEPGGGTKRARAGSRLRDAGAGAAAGGHAADLAPARAAASRNHCGGSASCRRAGRATRRSARRTRRCRRIWPTWSRAMLHWTARHSPGCGDCPITSTITPRPK